MSDERNDRVVRDLADASDRPDERSDSAAHPSDDALRERFPVPQRAALPRPERINRNALTVAAVAMGVLVIGAVVFMPADRAATRPAPATSGTDVTAPAPTYLDRLPQEAGVRPPAAADTQGLNGRADADFDGGVHGGLGSSDAAAPYTVPVTPAEPDRAVEARAAREVAFQAALEAPLFAPSAAAQVAVPAPELAGAGPTMTEPAPTPTQATAAGRPAAAMWGRHQAFMAEAARGGARAVRTSVDSAPGPYALQEGTLIPAVLVTEVNSDLPGAVLAQVARDVYDSRTQRTVLIPAGSRLVGAYEHQLAVGQDRLLVAWTRVIFPDGRSITLPGLETKDAAGAGGVRDRVDRHTRQVFGTATLLSLVGAAVQLSQPNGGYGLLGAVPSAGQAAAGAAGQQLAQVATQMLQRDMDVQPTIRIRQGTPFNVFVSADLTFPAPYAAGP